MVGLGRDRRVSPVEKYVGRDWRWLLNILMINGVKVYNLIEDYTVRAVLSIRGRNIICRMVFLTFYVIWCKKKGDYITVKIVWSMKEKTIGHRLVGLKIIILSIRCKQSCVKITKFLVVKYQKICLAV